MRIRRQRTVVWTRLSELPGYHSHPRRNTPLPQCPTTARGGSPVRGARPASRILPSRAPPRQPGGRRARTWRGQRSSRVQAPGLAGVQREGWVGLHTGMGERATRTPLTRLWSSHAGHRKGRHPKPALLAACAGFGARSRSRRVAMETRPSAAGSI